MKTSEGLLLKMDDTGQLLMGELLMNPLRQGYKAVVTELKDELARLRLHYRDDGRVETFEAAK